MQDDVKRALTQRLTVPVVTAGKAFGLGRNASYTAVKTGQIPSFKFGGKLTCPTAPLRKMLGIDAEAV